MNKIIALLNCHNSPELGELTSNRPLASTSFLGRYAFMDFAMSNFTNSGIQNVNVLVKNHQRSLLKHMGNMMSWVNNTKTGRDTIFYNEKGILNPAYNTDINNIKENDWVLYESNANLLVFEAPEIVASIDLRPFIEEHQKRMEEITIVYKEIDDANKEFIGADVLDIDEDGYLKDAHKNKGDVKKAKVSLQIWIINRKTLVEMIDHSNRVDSSWGIAEYLKGIATNDFIPTKIHCVPFNGYARRFDSLAHYVEYSFELLNRKPYEALFKKDWPIFTRTHDTPPAIYGTESEVSNSFVSNGCVVEGTVKDSIICRSVKVKKGAKVNRSIVLSNCVLEEKSAVSDVVIDKYSTVAARHKIQGDKDDVIYIKQGAKV